MDVPVSRFTFWGKLELEGFKQYWEEVEDAEWEISKCAMM